MRLCTRLFHRHEEGPRFLERLREKATTKRVGVALAAASLVPGSVLAATYDAPQRPPPIVRVVDAGQMRTLDAQIQQIQLSREPKTITRTMGTDTVQLRISKADLAAFTPEQKQAYAMLKTLFETIEPAQDAHAALERLIPREQSRLRIDRAAVIDTASRLAEHGLPLTREGMSSFRAHRGLENASPRELALRYASALDGGELLYALPAQPTQQQRAAAEVFRQLARPDVEKLLKYLRVEPPKDGPLALQTQKLNNLVVSTQALDRLIEEANIRGRTLEPGANASELVEFIHRIGERPAAEHARALWYQRVVESQGLEWRGGVNQVNVIGLRGYDVDRGRNDNAFNRWNDTLALVWRDEGGNFQVREFRATTDPGLTYYPEAPDANGDGSGDVANLFPGQYPYSVGTHRDLYGAGNPAYNLPVARDTNHDGNIQPAEARASRERGDAGTAINIHWGPGGGATAVEGYSAGCQVAQISHGEFRAQITPVLEMNRGQLTYALIDMSRVA